MLNPLKSLTHNSVILKAVRLSFLALCLLPLKVWAEDTPAIPTYEQLAAQAEFRQAEISPDGTYLAVDVVHEGRRALAVLKTEDLEVIKVSGF